MMAYTLVASERSPFARACRILMQANKIPFRFHILNFVDDEAAAAELKTLTPINKVPILVDDEQKIFDSRVIASYLSRKHNLPALSIDEENKVSALYSLMDTGVLLFLMKKDGLDVAGSGFLTSRLRARIPDNMEYLRQWADQLDPKRDWRFPAMMLLSFLRWGEARAQVIQLKDWPEHAAFMERFKNAPGVAETDF